MDPKKFEILKNYDFPIDLKGEYIVCYDMPYIRLYDIFEKYGTEKRPDEDPSKDEPKPEPKEKKPKPPPAPVVKSDLPQDEEEGIGEGEDGTA